MTSEAITVESPSPIVGDAVTQSICPNGTSCGAMDDQQCSGGYNCDNDTSPAPDPGTDYQWPTGTPFPDDPNKVPVQCDLPTNNIGRNNNDPLIPLTNDQIQQKTTDAWRVEVDVFPNKPVIIQAAL